MMDANMENLAAEIDRIVDSPYPTQLKTLHTLVSQTQETDICLWAKCYRCRISPLTQALLDALPQWPYVLDIITRLACAVPIRDALIEAAPSLLDQVVSKSVRLQSESRKYLDLSVSLLLYDLPTHITIPAAAQTLLIQLFERAAAQPDVSTLKPIHRLINGACRELVSVLPLEALAGFEESLMSIMRALFSERNKTPVIYCLSIMKAILDQHTLLTKRKATDDMSYETESFASSQLSTFQQWKPEALASLFRDKRSGKTLTLITHQVIWACTPGIEKRELEAPLASVAMANEFLGGIALNEREEWCKQNTLVVRKLQERCLVPDLSHQLRLQSLAFLASIAGSAGLSPQHNLIYEQLMLSLDNHLHKPQQLDLALELSLHRFAPGFTTQFWDAFVSTLLDLAVESKAAVLLRSEASALCLLEGLSKIVEHDSKSRQGLVSAFSSFRYRQKLDKLLANSTVSTNLTEDGSYCNKVMTASRNSFASSICNLLLRAALAVQSDETKLPSELISGILKRHSLPSSSLPYCLSCDRRPRIHRPEALLLEIESTPHLQDVRLPWKDRLALKLRAQAEDQQQAVITSIAEICRDLEERCLDSETPLHQEQEKLADLQSRHENLGKAYGELECQIMDRELRINVLESENDAHAAQLEEASSESQDLLKRIEKATEELQQANEKGRVILATAQQEKSELELEHATAMACKQQVLDETKEELQRSHYALQNLRSELGRLEEGGKHDHAHNETLQSSIHVLEQKLRDSQDRAKKAEEEREALAERHRKLQQDLEHVQDESAKNKKQNESLVAELDDLKAESRRNMQRAASSFEDTMARTKQEWLKIKDDLEQRLEEAHDELVQAGDGFHEQQEANKQRTAELRKRIDRLSKDCQEKDAQVAEAQEMRNRLMNAMGLAAMPAALPAATTEPSTKSSTLPYRSASTMATPKPSSQPVLSTPAQEADDLDLDEEEANESYISDAFSDHEPTPKRARPRQSLGQSSVHQQRQSISRRSVKSVLRTKSATKRQPLLDLDINRSPPKAAKSPTKVAFKETAHRDGLGMSTAEEVEMDDWSFNDTDLLAGTPGFGLDDRREYLEEESTVDV